MKLGAPREMSKRLAAAAGRGGLFSPDAPWRPSPHRKEQGLGPSCPRGKEGKGEVLSSEAPALTGAPGSPAVERHLSGNTRHNHQNSSSLPN